MNVKAGFTIAASIVSIAVMMSFGRAQAGTVYTTPCTVYERVVYPFPVSTAIGQYQTTCRMVQLLPTYKGEFQLESVNGYWSHIFY